MPARSSSGSAMTSRARVRSVVLLDIGPPTARSLSRGTPRDAGGVCPRSVHRVRRRRCLSRMSAGERHVPAGPGWQPQTASLVRSQITSARATTEGWNCASAAEPVIVPGVARSRVMARRRRKSEIFGLGGVLREFRDAVGASFLPAMPMEGSRSIIWSYKWNPGAAGYRFAQGTWFLRARYDDAALAWRLRASA